MLLNAKILSFFITSSDQRKRISTTVRKHWSKNLFLLTSLLLTLATASIAVADTPPSLLSNLTSPVIFQGDETFGYRDPTAIYEDGVLHLYFTWSTLDTDGGLINVTAHSQSTDMVHWTDPVALTPYDRNLNYCSPGNIIEYKSALGSQWWMCVSSYPTPNPGQVIGSNDARLWIMRSADLENWSEPELIPVKGPDVSQEDMGRMIDPYLFEDKDEPGKWWCFYKQNGASRSWSNDLKTWNYVGSMSAGENVCMLIDDETDEYIMFASPSNGISVSRSSNLTNWTTQDLLTLGQDEWDWADGRLTAGFVVDLRDEPLIGKYVMFFHGSQASSTIPETHGMASLGIAWSDDLMNWEWPEAALPGDANRDGRVDGSDVTILAGNWQTGVDGELNATWTMGDFNGDGCIDGSDVTILAGNWQIDSATTTAVPEPNAAALLLTALLATVYYCPGRKI